MKYWAFFALVALIGCSKEKEKETKPISEKENKEVVRETLFKEISPEHSHVTFKNTVTENLYFNFLNYSYIYNGGGVAVGDIDNDGLEDVYLTSNQQSNKLYLNKGGFVFEDITRKAGVEDDKGWTTGVSMIDINADGWLDIYVCKSGDLKNEGLRNNLLFMNQKDGTFKEEAKKYGLDSNAFSVQAYYFDYDKDGDLDVYLVNHRPDFNNNVTIDPRIQQDIRPESTDQLFENQKGVFVDVSKKAGILNKAWGLSASIGDFNNDGWIDVFVANDFLEPDFLYINNGDGTFSNKNLTHFDHISANSMGSDYADINNDQLPDLIVLDMLADDYQRSKENMATMSTENFNELVAAGYHHQYMSNMLQLNEGKGIFSEIGQLSGITKTDWSWAPLLADFDNDGFNDLFVTNGIEHDLSNQDFRNNMKANIMRRKKVTLETAIAMMPSAKLKNRIFKNNRDFTFSDKTLAWGFEKAINSNGAAYSDLDNDGDLDLVVNNQGDIASIYKNEQKNHYVGIGLKGAVKNPNGIGAKVTVYTNQMIQEKEVYTSRGYQSTVSNRLLFGLGATKTIDSILVRWEEGITTVLKNQEGDQYLTIAYDDGIRNGGKQKQEKTVFAAVKAMDLGIDYVYKDNTFDDYKVQLLLPQQQSKKGAALAVGDINGDGLEDFFIGNAKHASGALYIQQKNGTFVSSNQSLFSEDKAYEDSDALFFDKDGDGDLDLYVASGSYEDSEASKFLHDRVYENIGNGKFKRDLNFPSIATVTATVTTADYDGDGDLDLFIGGGVMPGKYPLATPSYILENQEGIFADVTKEKIEGIEKLRIVSDAVFSDYDKDGDKDLLVVGEWMPLTVFNNKKGVFTKAALPEFSNKNGWYFSIVASDYDKDGDVDYLLGNLGTNNKFRPKKEKPFHIYARDFDGNNSFDVVLSKESNGVLVPVRGKQCSSEQVPMLTTKIKTFKEFANSSLGDIYGDKDLESATHYEVHDFRTTIAQNQGDGTFLFSPIAGRAQFGPTMDFLVDDFNNDGYQDVFGIGTLYEAEVETIRYDASKGYLMMGEATGTNDKVSSALLEDIEARKLAPIVIGNEKYILILTLNKGVKVLKYKK
ncbi:VCBS repeat-containing protein [Aquimarina sp. TRL1]|uniref:FG-GAP-like repeat-containing protein n=1 Tax=Aquimarina sp. (strain TRL1) TaxID=2736252 RepID=UPI00158C4151|nr:FG-GAP-like repeat-containing protein [Aquimarina sp. TRL1]QKX04354.1 VCBS repeat-containing protein [Aquimarina sp. TRL1]